MPESDDEFVGRLATRQGVPGTWNVFRVELESQPLPCGSSRQCRLWIGMIAGYTALQRALEK